MHQVCGPAQGWMGHAVAAGVGEGAVVVGQNAVADFDPDKLRRVRQAARLTQRELADRAGVPATTIAKWEGGFHRPYASSLAVLAAALGVPPDSLTTSAAPAARTLAQLRVAAGLTQSEAAARARLVRTRYSAVERGEIARLPEAVVTAIAAALGVDSAAVRTAHAAARAVRLESH
jgi:transcriptional regulator with XRE-family HTH domain